MALHKQLLHHATGIAGDYVRLTRWSVDRQADEASAHFGLFASAESAALVGAQPVWPVVAKLRCPVAVLLAASAGGDVRAGLYSLVKGGPAPAHGVSVVSDWGSSVLVSAADA